MNDIEALLASIFEFVMARDWGREMGPRTEHDYNDGLRWAVDLAYEAANPPVAVELTSVQDDAFLGTHSAATKLASGLSATAAAECLGGWEITIWESARVSALRSPILEVLRLGADLDVEAYTSADLTAWEADGSLDAQLGRRRALKDLGIARFRRDDSIRGVVVATAGESVESWTGIVDLDAVVDANVAKIEVTGLEGHLVVGVGRYQVSTLPEDTAVPTLPPAISRFWLVRLWYVPSRGYSVWSAGAGSAAWTVHEAVAPQSLA